MLILLQSPAEAPPLPWWVLYAVLLGITFGTWRAARSRWWKGCLTAAGGWIFIFLTAALTLPNERRGLMLVVAVAPVVGFLAALRGGRKDNAAPAFAAPRWFTLSWQTMQGQPSARSVLRSKLMGARVAAGMPRDAAYVARLAYLSGLPGFEPGLVDLFVADGNAWVAPLRAGVAPVPIALRDLLRVDVWPEGSAPPTLRLSWSPPAGELTRELVLGPIPTVPPPLVGRQLNAIAGAVANAMQHDEKAAMAARRKPAPVAPPTPPR